MMADIYPNQGNTHYDLRIPRFVRDYRVRLFLKSGNENDNFVIRVTIGDELSFITKIKMIVGKK